MSGTNGKLSSFMYRMLFNDMSQDICTYSWLKCIKGILDSVGLTYVWNQQRLLAHLSRRLIGELIVYTGIRRPSVRRPSTFSNDISSETVRPILSILHT